MAKSKLDLGSKLGATLSDIKNIKDGMSAIGGGSNGPSVLPSDKKLGGQLKIIPVASVFPNPDQPRKVFKQSEIDSLSESIKVHGLIQPIVVRERKNESGKSEYLIVAGERRYRATSKLKHRTIQAIVLNWKHAMDAAGEGYEEKGNDKKLLELALLENLQRENLNAIEQGNAYYSMQTDLSYTIKQIAESLKISESLVKNRLRLVNKLEEFLKIALVSPAVQFISAHTEFSQLLDSKQLNQVFQAFVQSDLVEKLEDADIALGFQHFSKEDRNTPAFRAFLTSNTFKTFIDSVNSETGQSYSIEELAKMLHIILAALSKQAFQRALSEEAVGQAFYAKLPEQIASFLLKLQQSALQIEEGELPEHTLFSEGHARSLLNLEAGNGQQKFVYEQIMKDELTVRQTEALVKKLKEQQSGKTADQTDVTVKDQTGIDFNSSDWKSVGEDFSKFFETKQFKVDQKGKKMTLSVTFDSSDALDTFIQKVQNSQ